MLFGGASLPLKNNPNFLPMWLSPSLLREWDPEKAPALDQAFVLGSFRHPETLELVVLWEHSAEQMLGDCPARAPQP